MRRLPGYIWSLPLTVVGLIFALVYVPRSVRWSRGCVEVVPLWILGNPDAQTWGWLIFYRSRVARAEGDLRVHERVHVVQAFWGGMFFAAAYGAHWLWLFLFDPPERVGALDLAGEARWYRAYRGVYFEKVAYRVQAEYRQGLRPGAWGS